VLVLEKDRLPEVPWGLALAAAAPAAAAAAAAAAAVEEPGV